MPDTATETMPATASEIAAHRGAVPYIGMNGKAAEAAAFYVRAFGAEEVGRFDWADHPGQLMHCALTINGGGVMLTDCVAPGETPVKPQGFHLQLVVADGDAWWSRAVEAGCKVTMPFEKMFWGDRWGLVEDPFGITWGIDEPAR